jgi:hypothetical protein
MLDAAHRPRAGIGWGPEVSLSRVKIRRVIAPTYGTMRMSIHHPDLLVSWRRLTHSAKVAIPGRAKASWC